MTDPTATLASPPYGVSRGGRLLQFTQAQSGQSLCQGHRTGGRRRDVIEAARRWLLHPSERTGYVGVIGFCMGGGYAKALAADRGFDAASVSYGGCSSEADEWLPDACPIVGASGPRTSPHSAGAPAGVWAGC